MDVAAALDFYVVDDGDCGVAQHVVFLRRQRLRGCYYYAVAGVYADRVDVFHTANGYAVADAVANYFELDFLVALNAFLDKSLSNTAER